jgi:adenylate cyclase
VLKAGESEPNVRESQIVEIAGWIADAGLSGASQTALLNGFCERVVAAGLPLKSGLVVIDTLHPTHEGHAVRWRAETGETTLIEYGRTNVGEAAENWQRSPFYHLLQTGEPRLIRRLSAESDVEFPNLASERERGMTEYVCLINKFAAEGIIGEMDCVYSGWLTDRAEGFLEPGIAALQRLMPFLAMAMKCLSLGGIARTLVETYLGRDAGRLVLGGRIERGIADRIDAVLWFSDLRGYTKITDTAPTEQIIPLLNDYAEVIVAAIEAHGGDVLKLIGDGVLAIFRAEERERACFAALEAAVAAHASIADLNERRAAGRLPTTHMYVGLHVGEVFFGNVGGKNRLDFTVVGPAVNETSRIAAMCRSVDQMTLVSSEFARALDNAKARLVSVGRYSLRGVNRPQELFTIESSPDA